MTGKSSVRWRIKELSECIRKRQRNKFDANIGVSGARGNGKSTFLFKIFNSFKKEGFNPRKHQVYSQNEVIGLLSDQKFSYCWDDEAINSGYKRDFAKVGQIQLIKTITNYRDNFNIYGSALPFFYSLDKALRELIFMHVHIIERGLGVILLPLEGQIHSQDPWDTITNKKIEEKENRRLERNPDARFRYHKLTTFAGYVYFTPMTKKQELKYLMIKDMKRRKEFENQRIIKPKSFIEKLYDYMKEGKLTREMLMHSCYIEGAKYSSVLSTLNGMLKDDGVIDKSVKDFLKVSLDSNSKIQEQIKSMVPDI